MLNLSSHEQEKFSEFFLDEYLKNGLGSLSKRDIDLLILKLVLDFQLKKSEQELDVFALSHKLKISITKLRNLIKEVQIRYGQLDESVVKKRIIYIFEKNRWRTEGNFILLSIVDPLLRDYFLELIHNENSFADYSFNPEIIKIDKQVFSKIIIKLSGKDINEIKELIPENLFEQIEITEINQTEIIIEKIININTNISLNFDISKAIGAFLGLIFKTNVL